LKQLLYGFSGEHCKFTRQRPYDRDGFDGAWFQCRAEKEKRIAGARGPAIRSEKRSCLGSF